MDAVELEKVMEMFWRTLKDRCYFGRISIPGVLSRWFELFEILTISRKLPFKPYNVDIQSGDRSTFQRRRRRMNETVKVLGSSQHHAKLSQSCITSDSCQAVVEIENVHSSIEFFLVWDRGRKLNDIWRKLWVNSFWWEENFAMGTAKGFQGNTTETFSRTVCDARRGDWTDNESEMEFAKLLIWKSKWVC